MLKIRGMTRDGCLTQQLNMQREATPSRMVFFLFFFVRKDPNLIGYLLPLEETNKGCCV